MRRKLQEAKTDNLIRVPEIKLRFGEVSLSSRRRFAGKLVVQILRTLTRNRRSDLGMEQALAPASRP